GIAASRFTFEKDGASFDRELVALPTTDRSTFVASANLPMYLRDPSTFYRFDYLAREQLLYVQYNVCAEIPGKPFTTFLAELQSFAATHAVSRFVIDL